MSVYFRLYSVYIGLCTHISSALVDCVLDIYLFIFSLIFIFLNFLPHRRAHGRAQDKTTSYIKYNYNKSKYIKYIKP